MTNKKEIDKKPKTLGHSWDGIEELNNSDPLWLRLLFYGAVFFGLFYFILYPSWPTPHNHGLLNWTSNKELKDSIKEVESVRAQYQIEFDKASFAEILQDTKLLNFALAGGKSAFQNNCAPCHGTEGHGSLGYPNLAAGSWMWGGKVEDIYTTLLYGIRSEHEETRQSNMAAFGRENILTKEQIDIITKHVINLNSHELQSKEGSKLYQDNCSSCHGADGSGNYEFGAPNLKDSIWLYGGSYDQIYDVIYNGRAGVMPYWTNKLSDSTIRQLAIYVHQLGGGEK
jgi:cytochrome c oxidase cbb3-type subunit III